MTQSKLVNRYSPEVRARAVRILLEHQGSYETQAGAKAAMTPKIGYIPQTLRLWVRQAKKNVSISQKPPDSHLDGMKFQGSSSSIRFCEWPVAIASRVALRWANGSMPLILAVSIKDAILPQALHLRASITSQRPPNPSTLSATEYPSVVTEGRIANIR